MKRLGSADFGVSISLLPPNAPFVTGGAGRANGFGGPVAPALSNALAALGEGGGNTAPARIGVTALAVAVACGEESAVCLSSSEDSVGICTFSLGRLAWRLFVRLGGWICPLAATGVEAVR